MQLSTRTVCNSDEKRLHAAAEGRPIYFSFDLIFQTAKMKYNNDHYENINFDSCNGARHTHDANRKNETEHSQLVVLLLL